MYVCMYVCVCVLIVFCEVNDNLAICSLKHVSSLCRPIIYFLFFHINISFSLKFLFSTLDFRLTCLSSYFYLINIVENS